MWTWEKSQIFDEITIKASPPIYIHSKLILVIGTPLDNFQKYMIVLNNEMIHYKEEGCQGTFALDKWNVPLYLIVFCFLYHNSWFPLIPFYPLSLPGHPLPMSSTSTLFIPLNPIIILSLLYHTLVLPHHISSSPRFPCFPLPSLCHPL